MRQVADVVDLWRKADEKAVELSLLLVRLDDSDLRTTASA